MSRTTQKVGTKPTRQKLAMYRPQQVNANKHTQRGMSMLEGEIRKVGYVAPMTAAADGEIFDGSARLETSADVYGLDVEPIVIHSDGTRPIIHVRDDIPTASDPRAVAASLAANRIAEVNLAWDPDALLALQQQGADLSAYFREDELAELLQQNLAPVVGQTDPDEVPKERVTDVRLGDLFELGAHRLLCGDSTKVEHVARVMGQDRAGLMNTDPPYGINFDNAALGPTRKDYAPIKNDELHDENLQRFLEATFRIATHAALKPNAAWYLWHAHLTQGFFAAAAAAAAAAKVVLHRQIIWVKPCLILGRGHYHWKHEPCFMGWVEGHQPPDYGLGAGERTQTTVWEVDSVTRSERKSFEHSTPKPVGLFTIPIIKHLRRGEVCYEPFAGSGPQVIAAEMSGVSCRAIELEPRFVQVIIDRWEAFTGGKAIKVGEAKQGKGKVVA